MSGYYGHYSLLADILHMKDAAYRKMLKNIVQKYIGQFVDEPETARLRGTVSQKDIDALVDGLANEFKLRTDLETA